jgi:RNA polymerase sigma factor (sigma-70 family)
MRELDAAPTTKRDTERDGGPVVVTPALVRAHQAALWRYLRVLGADADEAADLAQETFVVLLRRPVEDRGDAALRTWLRTTARHLFHAACRARRRSPLALDADAVERAWARYERDDDGAAYRTALARCLELLPAPQRELVEGAATAQRGDDRGARTEAERSRLRRLKQALRDCVRRRIDDDD